MAVTFVAASTSVAGVGTLTTAGTASVTATLPAGTAAGDRVFLYQAASNTSGTAPTGWTQLYKDVQVGVTGTAPGVGTGRRYISAYWRDYDGAWTMPALALTSATQNSNAAAAMTLRKAAGDTWDTPTFSAPGHDTTSGTGWSVTIPSFTTVAGALLMTHSGNTAGASVSGQNLSQSGAALANVTERYDNGTSTGNDVRLVVDTADVTTGATAPLTYTMTLAAAATGGTCVVQQTVTSVPLPKADTVVDTFDTEDTTNWTGWAANSVRVVNGELVITPTSGYPGLTRTGLYDIVGSHFGAELLAAPTEATGTSATANLKVQLDGSNAVELMEYSNGVLECKLQVAGANNSAYPARIAGTTHYRIRVDTDRTITWEALAGGTWQALRTGVALPAGWTGFELKLLSGFWDVSTGVTNTRWGSAGTYAAGTPLAASASSTAGATDSHTVAVGAQRSAVSTADASDAHSRTLDAARSTTSTAGAADTHSWSMSADRGAASTAGAVDSHTWSLASDRVAASTAAVTDTHVRALTAERGETSLAGAGDAHVRALAASRTATSTAGAGDSHTWTLTNTPVRTFYVSAAGNDNNNGLTTGAAWATLGKVASSTFIPGDAIMFRGGDTFTGELYLAAGQFPGTAADPITIGSYGTGRATLTSTASGIKLYNSAGVVLRDLNLVGNGASGKAGVDTWNDTGARLNRLDLINLDISGFWDGVLIGGAALGYTNVTVDGCTFHNNIHTGFFAYGSGTPGARSNTNINVTNCVARDNQGSATVLNAWTGSGIIISQTDGGKIENCVAYGNGTLGGATAEGPCGIWSFDANNVVITTCLSYNNRTGSLVDGDGFDLDMGCTNCRVEYCLAYGNDGAGILLFDSGSASHNGNVVRYNLTWGNAQKGSDSYGELTAYSSVTNDQIYGNTFIAGTAGASGQPAPSAVRFNAGTPSGNTLRNNILVVRGNGSAVRTGSTLTSTAALFQGNAYHRVGTGSLADWNGTHYTTLTAWRAAVANQEMVSGSPSGFVGDPQLVDVATSPTVTSVATLDQVPGLKLQASSPVATAGLDLPTLFSTAIGTRDFYGGTLTAPYAIGAHELVPAVVLSATSTAGATDTATRALDAARSAADAVGATDTASASLTATRSTVSTAGAVDGVAVAVDYVRTVSSGAGATDVANASLTATRSASSDAGVVDSAATAMDVQRVDVDVAGAVDTVAVVRDVVISVSSGAGAVDAVTAGQDYTRAASSGADATDVAARTVVAARSAVSSADARDEVNIAAAGQTTVTATSSAGVTDQVAVIRNVTINVLSGAGAVDAVTPVRDVRLTATSSAAAVDSATVSAAGVTDRAATSVAGATDAATITVDSGRVAVSAAGATDNVTWEMARVVTRTASSGAGAVDTVAAIRDVHLAAISTAGAVDVAGIGSGTIATAVSTASATDNHSWTISTFHGAYRVVYSELRHAVTRGRLRFATTNKHEET